MPPSWYWNSKVSSDPYCASRVAFISPALKKSLTVPSKPTVQSSVVLGAAAARMTACPGAAVPPETALTSAVPNF
jgi:hypothetical protein